MRKFLLDPQPVFKHHLLLIRLVAGLLILVHGFGLFNDGHMQGNIAWLTDVHFPAPFVMAYIGKGAELLGGALLILGLFTRLASLVLVINMTVIVFVLGSGKIFADDETAFLLLSAFLYLFLSGPGQLSLDQRLFAAKQD